MMKIFYLFFSSSPLRFAPIPTHIFSGAKGRWDYTIYLVDIVAGGVLYLCCCCWLGELRMCAQECNRWKLDRQFLFHVYSEKYSGKNFMTLPIIHDIEGTRLNDNTVYRAIWAFRWTYRLRTKIFWRDCLKKRGHETMWYKNYPV